MYLINCETSSCKKDKLIVKWFGEDTFSSVDAKDVDVLGENLIDASRAARSHYITQQYNLALGQRYSYV